MSVFVCWPVKLDWRKCVPKVICEIAVHILIICYFHIRSQTNTTNSNSHLQQWMKNVGDPKCAHQFYSSNKKYLLTERFQFINSQFTLGIMNSVPKYLMWKLVTFQTHSFCVSKQCPPAWRICQKFSKFADRPLLHPQNSFPAGLSIFTFLILLTKCLFYVFIMKIMTTTKGFSSTFF